MEIFGEEKMWAGGWMDMAADRSSLRVSFIHFMQAIHEISFNKTIILTYSKYCIRFAFSHAPVLHTLCTLNASDDNIPLINYNFQKLVDAYEQNMYIGTSRLVTDPLQPLYLCP